MNPTVDGGFARYRACARRVVTALGSYAFVGAFISFLGWAADVPRFTDWTATGISIQPNTTVAALSAAAGLLLVAWGRSNAAAVLGGLVASIGGLTIFQYLSGVDLGVDTLLMFERGWGRTGVTHPGRMGPPAATSWTLIGIALVLASRARNSKVNVVVPLIGLATAGIASLSLVGYLYGAHNLYSLPAATAIALQTATFIFTISLGLVIGSFERDPMRLIVDVGPAGALLRRIVPAVVLIPIAIGFVRVQGERAGLYDSAFGSSLRTLTEMAVLLLLLWLTGNTIRREAQRRTEAHASLLVSEQSLRDADRRKDEFLAILAHELRNPLAPIRSAVELMRIDVTPTARLAKCRNVIDRQVTHMTRLLDDLLDAGRIAQGRLELRKQHVDLATVIRTAVETCSPLIEAAQQELTVTLPPRPIVLDADPVRLAQLFGNMLNNASKFTKPQGKVWVSATMDEGEAVVTVRDSGVGIVADRLSTIFEKFSQEGPSSYRSSTGLGIGLHLAHRLVEMHGGTVTAWSGGLGQGSEFVVRLPALVEQDRVSEIPEGHTLPTPCPCRRVLVVDDNEDAASSLAMLLEAVGNEAAVAQDGLEALEKASAYEPDVVLLDIGLPGMSGYDVCRTLRSQLGDRKLVIIALTGWGQDEDRRKSTAAGFDGHLVKPVSIDALKKVLVGDSVMTAPA